jgi:putative flippase GtrA
MFCYYENTREGMDMIQKIRALIEKYWDILSYLIFGVLTTVVNYIIYLPLYNLMGMSATASNAIAWVVAVAFAYLTNKPFVFRSHDWSMKTVIPELTKFVSCRIGSGVLETIIILVTVDILGWNGNIWKLFTSVMVVVLNYIASKLVVFRKK